MNKLKLLISIVVLSACPAFPSAQQPPAASPDTGLVLEVQYLRGTAPAYEKVRRSGSEVPGSWYGRFVRVSGWQLPAGASLVNAVRLTPRLNGEVVTIRVSVLRGEFLDTEDKVATYRAREGESVTFTELKNFGVEPFVIKVARVAHTESSPPAITNKSKSLEVVSAEPVLSSLPGFKLAVRNLADKSIAAVSVKVMKDGKQLLSGMPQGKQGEALLKPSSYGELLLPLPVRAQQTPSGSQPTAPSGLEFVIEALIFSDGSYEGDVNLAANYRAFGCGRKSEFKRLISALEAALYEADPDPMNGPAKLRSRVEALSTDLDESDFAALVQAFPTLDQKVLRGAAEAAVHGTRKMLLDELARFEHRRPQPADNFLNWMSATKDRYAGWLARL